jgi:hypothetical protein
LKIPADIQSRALTYKFLLSILASFGDYSFIFWYGKLNTIVDEAAGATLITIFTSINNSSTELPRTLGLKLVAIVSSFNLYAFAVYILGTVILVFTMGLSKELDTLPREK